MDLTGSQDLLPNQVKDFIQMHPNHILLDVREPVELAIAQLPLPNVKIAPLSDLARHGIAALPEEMQDQNIPILVFCHHGLRSAQVVSWLNSLGYRQVYNLAGGIDGYARQVDPSVRLY